MEYDLQQLFDHPLMLEDLLPSALAVFGGLDVNEYRLQVRWRRHASDEEHVDTLRIRWDLQQLEGRIPNIGKKVQNLMLRDQYQPLRTENAAVVVSVAVLENIEPGTRFSVRSDAGSYHDYFLNETDDEMVEVAGRGSSKRGLDNLFLEEKAQSDKNPTLRKRWVSVTVFSKRPRNRTEGLHDEDAATP